ncbi:MULTISPECIES: tRNA lysidine(34) synthetase TilS [Terrabacteria group]|uniref:tRNA lysidine(34) synthetase TilS n=1 Tax=Bacillati TaxID=1783272 RepID=UPI001C6E26A3|nr:MULTISPECIES: tRNA lysidine(34) synthetase TilS [Terrabacteria group]MBW9212941.1 tRNA lysidine(34) synthetase TilS [Trueperella sp. zg.1013]
MRKLEGKWLVAVSTGPDSMYLLHQCLECGMNVQIAHVNYHHRRQAEEEETFIRSFAKQHQIPLHVQNGSFQPKGNFEAEARNWRYDFFAKIVQEENLDGVLVAHQQEDLLETFFMQEEKGLEPAYFGLKERTIIHGIVVVRPLLNLRKEEMMAYLNRHQYRYFIDHTNLENEYRRNQIRHSRLETMSDFMREEVLKEIEKRNSVLQERRCRVATYIQQGKVNIGFYQALEKEDRLATLRSLLDQKKHHSKVQLEEMDQIVMRKNHFYIPFEEDYIASDGGFFFLWKEKRYSYTNIEMKDYPFFKVEKGEKGVNAVTVWEDDYPLTIRNYQQGDSIQLRFGKKRISRFFIDRKIPMYLRKVWPIVLNCKQEIILVPGLGSDVRHYSINPSINVIQYLNDKE